MSPFTVLFSPLDFWRAQHRRWHLEGDLLLIEQEDRAKWKGEGVGQVFSSGFLKPRSCVPVAVPMWLDELWPSEAWSVPGFVGIGRGIAQREEKAHQNSMS